jgi:hypothetical protein
MTDVERALQALKPARPIKDFDPRYFAIGKQIEMEHTVHPEIAERIAWHHMEEHGWPYYEELPKMEQRLAVTGPSAMGQNEAGTAGLVWGSLYTVLAVASTGLSAYHGYKRNDSIGWALWWGFCGGLFPVVTPAIAFAQGFGKPASR